MFLKIESYLKLYTPNFFHICIIYRYLSPCYGSSLSVTHLFYSCAIFYSTHGNTMSDIFCRTTSISTQHSGRHIPVGSLALSFWLGENRKPWQKIRERKRGEGSLPASLPQPGCFLQWRPLLLWRRSPLLFLLLNPGHRFLSLGLWRVTAPLLLNLGYWNISCRFPTS